MHRKQECELEPHCLFVYPNDEPNEDDEMARLAEVINRIINTCLDSDNPRATCLAIALAVNLPIVADRSISECANTCGISRQAMSVRVKEMQDELGLTSTTVKQWNSTNVAKIKSIRQREAALKKEIKLKPMVDQWSRWI